MENKMLTIQSFYRNQEILSAINTLLIHLDLHGTGIDDKIEVSELESAKKKINFFLSKINSFLENYNKDKNKPMLGIDAKQRGFIKSFSEAKRGRNYKSILFKKSISSLEELMQEDYYANKEEIMNSLSELSTLLEEQTSFDIKKILVEI